jgi:hypothetical protein
MEIRALKNKYSSKKNNDQEHTVAKGKNIQLIEDQQ